MKKNILRVVAALMLALVMTVSCSTRDGWVKVKGNKFIDPQGKELVFRGLCLSDPVICTEIGFCLADERGAHIPVISTEAYGEHITQYFESKGISFTVWCFDTAWAPTLISDWDFTPTTQGALLQRLSSRQKAIASGK